MAITVERSTVPMRPITRGRTAPGLSVDLPMP